MQIGLAVRRFTHVHHHGSPHVHHGGTLIHAHTPLERWEWPRGTPPIKPSCSSDGNLSCKLHMTQLCSLHGLQHSAYVTTESGTGSAQAFLMAGSAGNAPLPGPGKPLPLPCFSGHSLLKCPGSPHVKQFPGPPRLGSPFILSSSMAAARWASRSTLMLLNATES